MGARNHLVEGVSASGKTSVCHELRRRGFLRHVDASWRSCPST